MNRRTESANASRQASLKAHRERIGLVLVRAWVARSDCARLKSYIDALPATQRLRERAKR